MPSQLQTLETDLAFAFVEFGLSREAFLRQTPREWELVVGAWRDRETRVDRRTARVCMVLAWCHGNPDAKEGDFMPVLAAEEEPQTMDEMLAVLGAVAPGGLKYG